jgi:HEAT repeat protein
MALVKPNAVATKIWDDKQSFQTALLNLNSDDPDKRREAASILGETEKKSLATAELYRRVNIEQNYAVRQAIFLSLSKIATDEMILGAMDLLESEDAGLRNDAIELIKSFPDLVGPYMMDILQHPNPDVRIFAVNILESLNHPKVVEWLIKVISDDDDINVCTTAVDLLAEVGDKRAMVPLAQLELKFADEPFISFSVGSALERIAA